MRRIVALLASPLAVLGFAVLSPGTAGAAPAGACTSTTTIEQLKWAPNGNGYLEPVGTYHHGYVGSAMAGVGSYRIWHVTYRADGGLFAVYEGAYAVRCAPDGTAGAEVDLTRTPEQTLTSFDLRCGTAAFTAGTTSYAHVGSRTAFGTTWRYWRTTTSTSTLLHWGVTAARCP
ncbi:hypothetical protein [Saccharothrix luteola]|uniref:hypothetical protein n=1 Tax=Saccharothrix luteola TaxID=2893018 RepID=UPI001E341FB7|nr:hypothetical protein [Saccharothrix luteola]MCC8245984.1 hypothetical protein [Saccharothrix luteola]